jgi:hypothetical protein
MRRLAWFAGPLGLLFVVGIGAMAGPARALEIIGRGLAILCGVGTVLGIAYTILALGLIRPFFARRPRATQDFPAVTVLKPLHGDERDLLRRLSSFCLQDYPSPVQFVFGTRDAADPALGAVAALRRLHPAQPQSQQPHQYAAERPARRPDFCRQRRRSRFPLFAPSGGRTAGTRRRSGDVLVSRPACSGILAPSLGQCVELPVPPQRDHGRDSRPRPALFWPDDRNAAGDSRPDRGA